MMNINEETGASAVEFAIVLPLLILLLFGAIEFGLLLYNQQVITNASREGARFGIVVDAPRKTEAEIKNEVREYCNGTDEDGNLVTFDGNKLLTDADIVVQGAQGSFQDDLTVTVMYDYGFLVLANLGFGNITLTAQTVMKME